MFNNKFTLNLIKEFRKSVNIWWSYRQNLVSWFFKTHNEPVYYMSLTDSTTFMYKDKLKAINYSMCLYITQAFKM